MLLEASSPSLHAFVSYGNLKPITAALSPCSEFNLIKIGQVELNRRPVPCKPGSIWLRIE